MEVLQRTANRGSISTGYDIDNSVKMEADNSEFMERIITTTGNRKTWTHSSWVKRTEISFAGDGFGHTFFMGGAYGSEGCILRFNTGTTAATLDTLQIDIGAGSTLSRSHTSQVFRDTSAWYHIVLAVDTTQGTATDRFKLYVNGELVTSYYSRNNPAQNFDTSNNQAANSCTQHIGAYTASGTVYGKFCGYIAEVNHVDGAALAPTAFGEFDDDSGIWIPIEASPTYGTNGFFLDFADSGNLGDDESGNGLDFTEVNIAAADQATDTPTNNFATLNVLNVNSATASNNPTISEGATYHQSTLNDHWQPSIGTIGFTAGKWYFEGKIKDSNTNHGNISFGMGDEGDIENWGRNNDFPDASGSKSLGYIGTDTPTFDHDDIISVAVDADNGKVYFAKNNTYINSGDPAAGSNGVSIPTGGDANGTYLFGIGGYKHNNYAEIQVNFGGYTAMTISSAASDANGYGTFEYAPPSGYYALCTKNLAEYG